MCLCCFLTFVHFFLFLSNCSCCAQSIWVSFFFFSFCFWSIQPYKVHIELCVLINIFMLKALILLALAIFFNCNILSFVLRCWCQSGDGTFMTFLAIYLCIFIIHNFIEFMDAYRGNGIVVIISVILYAMRWSYRYSYCVKLNE